MSVKTAVAAATPDPWDEIAAAWELQEAAERSIAAIRDYWRVRAEEAQDEVQPSEDGMGPSGGGA